MNLREYLWNALVEEKTVVEELLKLDNRICHTGLTYFELIGKIQYGNPITEKINENIHLLTDGEVDTLYEALSTFGSKILTVHVGRKFLGLHRWLIQRTMNYYQGLGVPVTISLEDRRTYERYEDTNALIVIYGYPEFVEETQNLFLDKKTILIEK